MCTPVAHTASRRRAGFTLIEILAVVAILALTAAFVVPNLGAMRSRSLQQQGRKIAALCELARQRAIVTGIPHRLLIDLEDGAYRMEWLVTEAEASGEEERYEKPVYDLRGSAPLPLAAPRAVERSFRPLPGSLGGFEYLEDELYFAGLETPEGWIERGESWVGFERDGTATPTAIVIDDDSGRSIALDVLPLADAVRIRDANI